MLKRTISIILELYNTIICSKNKKLKMVEQEVYIKRLLPSNILPKPDELEVSIKVLPEIILKTN